MKVRIVDTTIQDIVNYKINVQQELYDLINNNDLDNVIYEDFSKYYSEHRAKYIDYKKFEKILRSISVDIIYKKLKIKDEEDYYSAILDGKWISIYIEVNTGGLNRYLIEKIDNYEQKNQKPEYGTGWDLS